jgi:regulator of protease activity HflC (stomatin/prohibitin superfamily)
MDYPAPRNRRRQQSLSSQRAPLLTAQELHRIDSPRGHFELSETTSVARSAYQPPQTTAGVTHGHINTDSIFETLFQDYHYYQGDVIENQNPAIDLAIPLFSHGCCCCQCVRTQEIGFTEDCGRFDEILGPGFHCTLWPFNTISGRLTLRIQQLDVTCETKTADNVFIQVTFCVLYRVAVWRSYEAYYRLTDPRIQIQACVLDVVRSTVPAHLTLDRLFHDKRAIADAVFTRLQREMLEYGYEIIDTLVTDVSPNQRVKNSMNEIYASRRIKQAAAHKGEAQKLLRICQAQAQVECDFLHGVGTAKQRREIVEGMQESVHMWTEIDVRIVKPDQKQVMDLLLVTQYLDVLNEVSSSNMQVHHGPAEVQFIRQNFLRDSNCAVPS